MSKQLTPEGCGQTQRSLLQPGEQSVSTHPLRRAATLLASPEQVHEDSCSDPTLFLPVCLNFNIILLAKQPVVVQRLLISFTPFVLALWHAGVMSVLQSEGFHLIMGAREDSRAGYPHSASDPPGSPRLYFEHFRKADFSSQHSCGDKLERYEWAHSLADFTEEHNFWYSVLGKSLWLLAQRRGRAPTWCATKTVFLRAGLNASLSPSTLPQLEQSLWSPAVPRVAPGWAELTFKGIFLQVPLEGVQEPAYLGANSTLKLWDMVSHGQATFWPSVALSPNLLTFETPLTLPLKGEERRY